MLPFIVEMTYERDNGSSVETPNYYEVVGYATICLSLVLIVAYKIMAKRRSKEDPPQDGHAAELCDLEELRGMRIIGVKGRTRNVSESTIERCIEWMEREVNETDDVVVMWDGDDLERTSFTGALIEITSLITERRTESVLVRLYQRGRLTFVYGMSTTNPYKVKPPRGVGEMRKALGEDRVRSIVAGVHSGQAAEALSSRIRELNASISGAAASSDGGALGQWVKDHVDTDRFGDGSGTWTVDPESGRFDRKRYSTYGYLLLGVALARLTDAPPCIVYLGGELGPVSEAERAYHEGCSRGGALQAVIG